MSMAIEARMFEPKYHQPTAFEAEEERVTVSELQRLVCDLLIKNQQLRAALAKLSAVERRPGAGSVLEPDGAER